MTLVLLILFPNSIYLKIRPNRKKPKAYEEYLQKATGFENLLIKLKLSDINESLFAI